MIDNNSTHAYRILDETWAEPAGKTITWSVASLSLTDNGWFASPSPLNAAEIAQVQRAFATWASVANVNFVQVADGESVDIRLGNQPISLSTGIVGETTPTFDTRSHLEHAQIEFNTNFINQRAFTADNIYALAVHEIGHALGLDHATTSNSIMYYQNAFESSALRTQLSSDDIAGIQALYGAPGSAVSPITDTVATQGAIGVGQPVTGSINHPADSPWYRVVLTQGQSYELDDKGAGTGDGTLTDPFLTVRDSTGTLLASDDDSGTSHNAHIGHFTASYSGSYFLDAEAYTVHDTGSFTLSVTADAPAPAPAPVASSTGSTDHATLFGSAGTALLTTGNGQMLVAAAGAETITGGGLNNTIFGGAGADSLAGGPGDDILVAGSGPATLDGGGGLNLIAGGSGSDVISVVAASTGALTGIISFGAGDKIHITPASWSAAQDAASQAALQIDSGGNAYLWLGHDPAANADKWIILLGTTQVAASDLLIG